MLTSCRHHVGTGAKTGRPRGASQETNTTRTASFPLGTLLGSELNLACHLRDLDGDASEPSCVPGEFQRMPDHIEIVFDKREEAEKAFDATEIFGLMRVSHPPSKLGT
jgi:hypothetical protein